MLDAQDRSTLLDSLRPPEGYELSFAIGTTFTLDLLALLTAPLGFTMFELSSAPDAELQANDALLLLTTLRRYAGKVAIFCEAGRIAVPRQHAPLFAELEQSVIEVLPPIPNRAFHAKIWVLRFESPEQPVRYRVLCASRNLTFDRAWDTVLALDGELTDRQVGYSANRPLSDFVAALPRMAKSKTLPEQIRRNVRIAADELRRVDFVPPEDFEGYDFHAFGIEGQRKWPFFDCDRTLVVSPFLTESTLDRLRKETGACLLVSRAESLDAIEPETLDEMETVYTLTPDAVLAQTTDGGAVDAQVASGLHAKLYVLEHGWDASVFTGSANATAAGFGGNVEFLVELIGKKSKCGIDALLGAGKGSVGLRSILMEYQVPDSKPELDEQAEADEKLLEAARCAIAARRWTANVDALDERSTFRLTLRADRRVELPEGVAVSCHPVMLHATTAVPVRADTAAEICFEPVSFEGLTAFFAFELRLAHGGEEPSIRFLINATLVGAPENRRERLTEYMLRDRQQVVRFLLLLLSNELGEPSSAPPEKDNGSRDGRPYSAGASEALLEPLLRALHRDPVRLDEAHSIIEDLRRTEEGRAKLPPGLDAIWEPVWAARRELLEESAR